MVTEISNKEKFNEKKTMKKRETTRYEQKFLQKFSVSRRFAINPSAMEKAEFVLVIPEVLWRTMKEVFVLHV